MQKKLTWANTATKRYTHAQTCSKKSGKVYYVRAPLMGNFSE